MHVLDDGRDRRFAPDIAPDVAETAARPASGGARRRLLADAGPGAGGAAARWATTSRPAPSLAVLEAMKMEHPVTAPYDATVVAVHCAAGDQITAGAELVLLEAHAP